MDIKTKISTFNYYYNLALKDLINNNNKEAYSKFKVTANYLREIIRDSDDSYFVDKKKEVDAILKDLKEKELNSEASRFSAKKEDDKEVSEEEPENVLPKLMLSDVKGLNDVKLVLKHKVINPCQHKEIYRTFNRKLGGGILLYGVPGNGKTMIVKALANELNANVFSIKCSDINSRWFGESEKNIKDLFSEARMCENAIIFFDEFDALGSSRSSDETRGSMNRVVSELLSQIQGFEDYDTNLILIAATNRPWDVDSALLRSGRFDTRILVDIPDGEARKDIIESELSDTPNNELDIGRITDYTNGYSAADVVEFVNRLKDLAIDRTISTGYVSPICNDDVKMVAEGMQSSVNANDVKAINDYRNNFKGAI